MIKKNKSNKIKVMMSTPDLVFGGAEIVAINFAKELSKNNIETIYYVSNCYNFDLLHEFDNTNIKVDISKHSKLFKLKALFTSIITIKKNRPTHVILRIGSLIHFILPILFYKNKINFYFPFDNMADLHLKYGKIKLKLYKYAFANGVKVISISDIVSKSITNLYDIPEKDIIQITNGISDKFYMNKLKKISTNHNKLVSVGTLYHIKNHEFLIKTIKLLKDDGYNYELKIVGGGVLFDHLSNLIRGMKLENDITLVGKSENVISYLNEADIFILPSISEGIPLSIIEAMACGLPIISTNVGGVPDLVKIDNGILIESNNKKQLYNAIIKLSNDDEFYKKIVSRNMEYAEEFRISNIYKKYMKLFQENSK